MTVLAISAFAAAAFLFGFLLGAHNRLRDKPAKRDLPVGGEELEKLRQEYSNFLSYDGTEQSQR